jgi:adenylate cyclase
MSKEIEHKYLLIDDSYKSLVSDRLHIIQGYISRDKNHTVRVRIVNDRAVITLKGANKGDTRAEFEYPVPVADAEEMLANLCEPPVIEKYRNIVIFSGNRWEIDEFQGALKGLVMAEIEIPSSDYQYAIPPFIGKNVTNDARYYNSNLIDKVPE